MWRQVVKVIVMTIWILICAIGGSYLSIKIFNDYVQKQEVAKREKEKAIEEKKSKFLAKNNADLQKAIMQLKSDVRRKCVKALKARFKEPSWTLYDITCDLQDPDGTYRVFDATLRFHFHANMRCLCRAEVFASTTLLDTHIWY